MLQKFDLLAEPYSASGSLAATGLLNQLGRPNYEVLELLIRESVQNSWDARDKDATPLYGLNAVTLTEEQRSFLRKKVYGALPPHPKFPWRATEFKTALAVYDRGTVGLEGPTQANVLPLENEFPRFADFVFNAGQSGIRKYSAGTYGYGKAAYFLASIARTICIHTRCRVKNRMQSRFLAIALGTPYNAYGKPFTGRWWWGRQNAKNVFNPLLDEEADEAGSALGLPKFDLEERGTTILIIEPAWGERSIEQAINFLIERLLYFAWPKMLSLNGKQPVMQFEAALEGQEVKIPAPNSFSPLHGFIEAYEILYGANEISPGVNLVKDIGSQRPKKHLGKLTLQKIAASPHSQLDTGEEPESIFAQRTHHVALMRKPELVVQYLEGPPLANDYFEYCGVFKADQEVDEIFAQAETPTHDKWEAEPLLDRAHKTYVRAVPRYVKKEVEEFVRANAPVGAGESVPLGAFANQLGTLLATEEGPGAAILAFDPPRPSAGSGSRPARRSRATVDLIEQHLFLFEGVSAVEYIFEIKHALSSQASQIQATIGALLDSGDIENDPPQNADSPRFLAWRSPDGSLIRSGTLTVPSGDTGRYSLIAAAPSGVAVRVEIKPEAVLSL